MIHLLAIATDYTGEAFELPDCERDALAVCDVFDDAKLNELRRDLQEAKSAYLALSSKVTELEAEICELKNWRRVWSEMREAESQH